MNKVFKILSYIFISVGVICLVVSFILFFTNPLYFNIEEPFNLEIANKFGGFISGVTGIFFTGTGAFLIFLAFKQQTEQFKLAQFETSFFNLLSHLQTIIEHISGPVRWANIQDASVSGRKYFYYQIRELKVIINNRIANEILDIQSKYSDVALHLSLDDKYIPPEEPINISLYKEFIREIYEEFYKSRYSYLGHYFRFVYNILKFVDDSLLDNEHKRKYANLIQAQMTNDELGLLLYNGLGRYGEEKLYPLLEEYELLSNIDKRVVDNAKFVAKLYPKTRFKFL